MYADSMYTHTTYPVQMQESMFGEEICGRLLEPALFPLTQETNNTETNYITTVHTHPTNKKEITALQLQTYFIIQRNLI